MHNYPNIFNDASFQTFDAVEFYLEFLVAHFLVHTKFTIPLLASIPENTVASQF
jgi:hypothetical protein